MRPMILVASAFCLLLAGCQKQSGVAAEADSPKSPGRFAGIGVFDVGRLWSEMAVPGTQKDPAPATIRDDEHIIVVVDSHTGEVRQCGDHSGYCVAMNPWTGTGGQNVLPVKLTKHAADILAEDQIKAKSLMK